MKKICKKEGDVLRNKFHQSNDGTKESDGQNDVYCDSMKSSVDRDYREEETSFSSRKHEIPFQNKDDDNSQKHRFPAISSVMNIFSIQEENSLSL